MSEATNTSPLSEPSPTSLDELWQRIDRHLSARSLFTPEAQKDLEEVVAAYRAQAQAWALAEASGKTRNGAKSRATKQQATLADLGLE